jgi:hypothetical protein
MGELLAALHTLRDFHGHPKRARAKFANYIGEQEMMHTLVNRISPLETRARVVAVIGDAIDDRGAMKNSVSPKLVRALKTAGVRCVEVDEFRTSMLDSDRHIVMHHPPMLSASSRPTSTAALQCEYSATATSTRRPCPVSYVHRVATRLPPATFESSTRSW